MSSPGSVSLSPRASPLQRVDLPDQWSRQVGDLVTWGDILPEGKRSVTFSMASNCPHSPPRNRALTRQAVWL